MSKYGLENFLKHFIGSMWYNIKITLNPPKKPYIKPELNVRTITPYGEYWNKMTTEQKFIIQAKNYSRIGVIPSSIAKKY